MNEYPINPEWEKAQFDLYPAPTPPINTGPAPRPHCFECGGSHEPSGATRDCIRYWKHLAIQSIQSVEWARTLLCSATPGKLLDNAKQVEWCNAFGKWFAESRSLPILIDDAGCNIVRAVACYNKILAGASKGGKVLSEAKLEQLRNASKAAARAAKARGRVKRQARLSGSSGGNSGAMEAGL